MESIILFKNNNIPSIFCILLSYPYIFRQNGNKPTLVALTNWTSLLPPVTETEEVIDLSGIPLEFLATPEPVFELMSPKLQMMCRRLDSNDLEPSQLIRLCQRHSMMCLEEVSFIIRYNVVQHLIRKHFRLFFRYV